MEGEDKLLPRFRNLKIICGPPYLPEIFEDKRQRYNKKKRSRWCSVRH